MRHRYLKKCVTWQTDALGAICSAPTDLAGAAVGFGAVALSVDAGRFADGIAAVVGLVAVAGHAPDVSVLVADVVVVVLKVEIKVGTLDH